MMKIKCKVTCVKVWMCLAVCGCLVTLILAAVVLSSYNFESVIGPLSCKLKRREIRNCCYDDSCIYGKQYQYYFSSNSTHCMEKFDIYNHPKNTTVQFTHKTGCYPSLKSLDESSPHWFVNDSIIFYVNKQCTEWIQSSVHQENVNKNLEWIAIILSFVGFSCVSMICGFLTMYHIEILTCFVDYCCNNNSIDCCTNLCDLDEDDDGEENEDETTLKRQTNGHLTQSHHDEDEDEDEEEDDDETEDVEEEEASSTVDHRHNGYQKGHRRAPSSVPSTIATTNIAGSHLSVEYAVQNQQQNEMENTGKAKAGNNSPNKGTRHRARGHSNASQISRLSPLSNASTENKYGWGQYQGGIRQFVVDEGDEKYRAHQHVMKKQQTTQSHLNQHHDYHREKMMKSKQLKHRVYNHLIQRMNDGDDHNSNGYEYNRQKFSKSPPLHGLEQDASKMSDATDDRHEVTSVGMSDSVYFENEWYDENATLNGSPKKSHDVAMTQSRNSSINTLTTNNTMESHRKNRRVPQPFMHKSSTNEHLIHETEEDDDDQYHDRDDDDSEY